ncbi:MAG: formylmethanofuran dehydrogenase subunit C [Burkholderiales bacterium]
MSFTFTLRQAAGPEVDLSPLVPEALAGKSRNEIEALELQAGKRRLPLHTLFEVSGGDRARIAIRNGAGRLLRVGARMRRGEIRVEGDCGAFAGAGMRGGRLTIDGSAGDFAGSAMRGGVIEIRGSAGNFLGAALAGDRQGMRGGAIVVRGGAGDRAGDRMRRGLILIAGDAGAFCGSRMLAGTILVKGKVGDSPGFALRRGSLLLASLPGAIPATFQDSGEQAFLFLALLERHMQGEGPPLADFLPLPRRARRYCGDLAVGGFGEILVAI